MGKDCSATKKNTGQSRWSSHYKYICILWSVTLFVFCVLWYEQIWRFTNNRKRYLYGKTCMSLVIVGKWMYIICSTVDDCPAQYIHAIQMVCKSHIRMCEPDCELALHSPQTVYIPFAVTANWNLLVFGVDTKRTGGAMCPVFASGLRKVNLPHAWCELFSNCLVHIWFTCMYQPTDSMLLKWNF